MLSAVGAPPVNPGMFPMMLNPQAPGIVALSQQNASRHNHRDDEIVYDGIKATSAATADAEQISGAALHPEDKLDYGPYRVQKGSPAQSWCAIKKPCDEWLLNAMLDYPGHTVSITQNVSADYCSAFCWAGGAPYYVVQTRSPQQCWCKSALKGPKEKLFRLAGKSMSMARVRACQNSYLRAMWEPNDFDSPEPYHIAFRNIKGGKEVDYEDRIGSKVKKISDITVSDDAWVGA